MTKATIYGDWDLHGDDFSAHEIGHNLGMSHAPCGNPADPDPNFPYADGTVGQYGFDVNGQTVADKTQPDIMSYCDPEWVSDYTYKMWYADQMATLSTGCCASPG